MISCLRSKPKAGLASKLTSFSKTAETKAGLLDAMKGEAAGVKDIVAKQVLSRPRSRYIHTVDHGTFIQSQVAPRQLLLRLC